MKNIFSTDESVKKIIFTDESVKGQIIDSISENLTDSDLESSSRRKMEGQSEYLEGQVDQI